MSCDLAFLKNDPQTDEMRLKLKFEVGYLGIDQSKVWSFAGCRVRAMTAGNGKHCTVC